MRKKLLLGNWKCNKNHNETVAYVDHLNQHWNQQNVNCVLGFAPTFLHLKTAQNHLVHKDIIVAAQDAYFQPSGAFTSSVSAAQLKADGINATLIGHSERRSLFGDNLEIIAAKVQAAAGIGLKVIFCFGETLAEYESNQTYAVLFEQITSALKNLSPEQHQQIIFAYEPVWAIGTGKTPTPNEVNQIIQHIRHQIIAPMWTEASANQSLILYGGSVNLDNVDKLLGFADVDGALVGGASLNAADFLKMAEKVPAASITKSH
ncbi:triosephosphate isomerase [Mycoplasmoides fastidiosum]|uniref:Triosephosphate isomerase n=1 Tax=Mycoplasmoides fastidiosum TaxID=92758 RepID=A0ABU0LZ81_9BACT|nr:triose-phosphate isomerase [Mycoplasmoides fastidiosum]MDQ0514021.1 triosephosphate isomerase [Mycoplasmoides fastidiosum]UUD37569.1 triose-phosphate isomerase [Mycoplasmoides fastidiosum]